MSFTPGHSGNPAGRPPGARNRATLALEERFRARIEAVFERVLEQAEAGDMRAARLVLARLMPSSRPICFEMPEIRSLADVARALSGLIAAIACGQVTPAEGAVVGRLMAAVARLLETAQAPVRQAPAAPAPAKKIQRNTMSRPAVAAPAAGLDALFAQLDTMLAAAGPAAAPRPAAGPPLARAAA
jgi:hypothetical protein